MDFNDSYNTIEGSRSNQWVTKSILRNNMTAVTCRTTKLNEREGKVLHRAAGENICL